MLPPFSAHVRLARPEDLPRLGHLALSGFVKSPQFPCVRPHFSEYPQDSVASFRMSYRRALLDPESIVVVVEDQLIPHEKESVCKELQALWPDYREEDKDTRVVVAVTSIRVPAGCQ